MPSNETAQSNIRRYVQGTQLQINKIRCNDESPNASGQVYCDAFVRHAMEGTEYQVRLKCDKTYAKKGRRDSSRHDSKGCVLDMPP